MIYMFCYDISDAKRLRKIAKILEKYGIRIQKSFFQASIKSNMVNQIKKEIFRVMNLKQDSFFIYPLCERCTRNTTSDGSGELINLDFFEIL